MGRPGAEVLRMDRPENCTEEAGYLEFHEAHIYCVLHRAPDPIARVLLAGPFASERHYSYFPWVRWARYLAARRMEALRFDYRGVGESTGRFEKMSFGAWREDVEFLAGWLTSRSPRVPLILQGIEMGSVLARKAFTAGVGDALLLWGAPVNANEVLRRPLSRHAFKNLNQRKSFSDYVRELESDQSLEVEGYEWTSRLWQESFEFEEPPARSDNAIASRDSGKPVRFVKLEGGPASLLKGSAMGYVMSHNLDLSDLFAESFDWIASALATPLESQ